MSDEGIVVVSTFDGMGCLYSTLKRRGVKVKKYFAYEINKYAMKAATALHSDIIHLGDITKASLKDFGGLKIDLYGGGSPCQGFSFAGKQLAFDDPRSKLFFEYVRLWNEIKKHNPDAKFLLENVQMKKNELRIISEYMAVFPVNINSNLQSAQNRNRWYWTNIRTKKVGLFDEVYTDIPQPRDKGILLKDILQPESEVDEKYYIKNPKLGFEGMNLNKKSNTLRTSGKGSQADKHNCDIIKVDKQGNEKADQNKAGCLTAWGHSGGNHSDMDIIAIKNSVNCKIHCNCGFDFIGTLADVCPSCKEIRGGYTNELIKSDCLLASPNLQKDNLIIQIPRGKNQGGEHSEKTPTLTSNAWEQNNILKQGFKLRRLTPREAGRLQTFTEKELDILLSAGISDTQLYKMLGNGWTIEPIAHIISFMKLD